MKGSTSHVAQHGMQVPGFHTVTEAQVLVRKTDTFFEGRQCFGVGFPLIGAFSLFWLLETSHPFSASLAVHLKISVSLSSIIFTAVFVSTYYFQIFLIKVVSHHG